MTHIRPISWVTHIRNSRFRQILSETHKHSSPPSKLTRLREEISRICKYAYTKNLIAGSGGNASVRVPNTEKVLVTPSGYSLKEINAGDLILINLEGKVLEGSELENCRGKSHAEKLE